MEFIAILAVIGLLWGIASDILGSSSSPSANSVTGWIVGEIKHHSKRHRKPDIPIIGLNKVQSCASLRRTCERKGDAAVECGKMIEVGYAYRRQLLRDPDIKTVDVAIMGTHLVLTVYKDMPG